MEEDNELDVEEIVFVILVVGLHIAQGMFHCEQSFLSIDNA